MDITIDDNQLACVSEYATQSGRSAADCIYEALDDWIKVVAAAAISEEKFNVIQFPGQLEVA